MKHTKRIVSVAALLLVVAGESEGQSAYERARLEAHRWEVQAAKNSVAQARWMLNAASKHHMDVFEKKVGKARNKVAQEKAKAERGNRDPDDLAKAAFELFVVEKHFSVAEARTVAAQSYLSASEARFVSAKAVFIAAESASEKTFLTTYTAYVAVLEALATALRGLTDIIKIDEGKLPREVGLSYVPHNDRPTADQVSTAWQRAAQAARAAERTEAIVEVLNDGGEVPQELLEPLPTEFGSVA